MDGCVRVVVGSQDWRSRRGLCDHGRSKGIYPDYRDLLKKVFVARVKKGKESLEVRPQVGRGMEIVEVRCWPLVRDRLILPVDDFVIPASAKTSPDLLHFRIRLSFTSSHLDLLRALNFSAMIKILLSRLDKARSSIKWSL